MQNRGRGVTLQKPCLVTRSQTRTESCDAWNALSAKAPSGNISKDSLVYQRKYLPGMLLQASPPRRPGQGRRNFAMNVPASRFTEKMAVTLALSLLVAAALSAPLAAAQ